MQISGVANFTVSKEHVWDALHNPEILKTVIPGCTDLELKENGEFDVILKLGIAAVKGEYIGRVKLEDMEMYNHYKLTAQGSGTPGHVTATMDCILVEKDIGCSLEWNCDAEIGGMIASVGNRVISGIAKFLAANFFKDIQKNL